MLSGVTSRTLNLDIIKVAIVLQADMSVVFLQSCATLLTTSSLP